LAFINGRLLAGFTSALCAINLKSRVILMMKIGQTEVNVWVPVAVAVIIIGLIAWAAWPKTPPPTGATEVLNNILKKEIAAKEEELAARDVQIKDYKNKLTVSEEKARAWAKKYADLQKEKENVKPPKTDKELRDRYGALGLPPAPIGVCGAGYVCFPTGFGE
jgi:hypothetical protein